MAAAARGSLERLTDAAGSKIIWQVRIENKFGSEARVDMAAIWSNATERSFAGNKDIITVDEGSGRWAVDPKRLIQTNVFTQTERPIRRAVVTDQNEDSTL